MDVISRRKSHGKALEHARRELRVVRRKLFFNTGWSGPSPERVIEEQKRVLDWLSSEGVSHHIYRRLRKDLDVLRSRLASLLGADADEIALTRSTTEGINIVLGVVLLLLTVYFSTFFCLRSIKIDRFVKSET